MTWEALEPVLAATGYEYARQGSYAPEGPLPASFFTFWNVSTDEDQFYDNSPFRAVWRWQIYFYTKDPSLMYSVMGSLIASARAAGFVPEGRAEDIDAKEPGYVGRTVHLRYPEGLNEISEEESQ